MAGQIMIVYEACEKTRNCDTMDRLRAMAADQNLPWDPAARIERGIAMIISAMIEIHGEEWGSQIDHQRKAVMVFAL